MPTWNFLKCSYTVKATNCESYFLCLTLSELKISIFQLSFLYPPLKFLSFRSVLLIKSSESATVSKYITVHLQAENPRLHFISVENNTDFPQQQCFEEILQKKRISSYWKTEKFEIISLPPFPQHPMTLGSSAESHHTILWELSHTIKSGQAERGGCIMKESTVLFLYNSS